MLLFNGTVPGSAARGSGRTRRNVWLQRSKVCAVEQRTSPSTSTTVQDGPSTSQPSSRVEGTTATFSGVKQGEQRVREQQKALAEYMALPASQYSVLDARKIERLDDDTFKCYVGELRFFNFRVEPVITVRVTVQERGCVIELLSCELEGSQSAVDMNARFSASMTNVVSWQATQEAGLKLITSDTRIEVVVQVPGWFSFVPVASIEGVGSRVMQSTLNLMVPRFLAQLEADYALWAAGDDSRKPLSTGQL